VQSQLLLESPLKHVDELVVDLDLVEPVGFAEEDDKRVGHRPAACADLENPLPSRSVAPRPSRTWRASSAARKRRLDRVASVVWNRRRDSQ
jgi:hypothetical protein